MCKIWHRALLKTHSHNRIADLHQSQCVLKSSRGNYTTKLAWGSGINLCSDKLLPSDKDWNKQGKNTVSSQRHSHQWEMRCERTTHRGGSEPLSWRAMKEIISLVFSGSSKFSCFGGQVNCCWVTFGASNPSAMWTVRRSLWRKIWLLTDKVKNVGLEAGVLSRICPGVLTQLPHPHSLTFLSIWAWEETLDVQAVPSG